MRTVTADRLQTLHISTKCCTDCKSTDLTYRPRTHDCPHSSLQQYSLAHTVTANDNWTHRQTTVNTAPTEQFTVEYNCRSRVLTL